MGVELANNCYPEFNAFARFRPTSGIPTDVVSMASTIRAPYRVTELSISLFENVHWEQ